MFSPLRREVLPVLVVPSRAKIILLFRFQIGSPVGAAVIAESELHSPPFPHLLMAVDSRREDNRGFPLVFLDTFFPFFPSSWPSLHTVAKPVSPGGHTFFPVLVAGSGGKLHISTGCPTSAPYP